MSKIPLSYRIIKNWNVSSAKEDLSIIDTKLDYRIKESHLTLVPDEQHEETNNVDDIRDEIRKEILLQIEEEKLNIIEKAREEANLLRLEAENLKEQIVQEGYEEGFTKGYKEGIKEAQKEGQIIKNNAISLIEEAQNQVREYFNENRSNLIQLAADMAESIVHSTIDTSSENILTLIKPILDQCIKKENIIITCHPDNSTFIKNNLNKLEDICNEAKFIILEDSNLEKNGCVIENQHQIVDLQIKKQMKSILEELRNLE